MSRLAFDLSIQGMNLYRFIDASIGQFRDAYPKLSQKIVSRRREECLRQYILNTIIFLITIYNILKSVFNTWHSMIWMAGSSNFEASAEHAPLSPPVEESVETPVQVKPDCPPPTTAELSGHSEDSFSGRMQLWLKHAEISDEPIERYDKLFLELIEFERFIDLLSRYNFLLRRKLRQSIEADKRNPLLNDPSLDTGQDRDLNLTDSGNWTAEDDSDSISEDDSDLISEDDYKSTSEDDSHATSEKDADLTSEADADANIEEADLTTEDSSWSIIHDTN